MIVVSSTENFRYQIVRNELDFYGYYVRKIREKRAATNPGDAGTLQELGEMLDDYPPMAGIYRGRITAEDGSEALMFVHPDMIEPLSRCTQLYADGTFNVIDCSIN